MTETQQTPAVTPTRDTTVQVDLQPHHERVIGATMPQLLDAAAHTWPDRAVLSFTDTGEVLTYRELRDQVTRVRSALEQRGLAPGDRIGLLLRNQVEFPLTWLAAVEAGAVVVPLNPKYTRAEVEFVAGDAGVSFLVAAADLLSDNLEGTAPCAPDRVVRVGAGQSGPDQFADLRDHPATPRLHTAGRRDLVGIQFTSGTTGLPKGCMLTHEYWVDFGVYGSALFDDPQQYLAQHPFYYMQNQAYLMMAMAGGGNLHVTPSLSLSLMLGRLDDLRIDFAWYDDVMLEVAADERMAHLAVSRAPVSGVSGERQRALERQYHVAVREWYASTEVGSGTFVPWDRDDLVDSGAMGYCVPNRESKIIGSELQELGPGETGELCLRGPGMMLGYWNRPEANAELFLEGGWFRTGDLVRKDADGLHTYIGRTRDVVRRNGENIAAAEVEQRLTAMPAVAEAAVIPVPDRRRGEEVKAIIVLKPGESASAADVADWARGALAKFKVPRYVEFRSELPYTASGKIHKVRLREEEGLTAATIDLEPPRPGAAPGGRVQAG